MTERLTFELGASVIIDGRSYIVRRAKHVTAPLGERKFG